MNIAQILESYAAHCVSTLTEHGRARRFCHNAGIRQRFVFESFSIGFSDGSITDMAAENESLSRGLEEVGILADGRDMLKGCITIPVLDENKVPVTVVGYSIYPQRKDRLVWGSPNGIFNAPFLRNTDELIFTDNPMHALALVSAEVSNVTFLFGDEKKYPAFIKEHALSRVVFIFEGHPRLYAELAGEGVSARRVAIDFPHLVRTAASADEIRSFIAETVGASTEEPESDDAIQEIEHGFLFRFPLLTYRVVGSFAEATMSMRVNIKATHEQSVFVDSIDLYKARDRRNFVFSLMDQFDIRDQLQLDQDLTRMVEIIEKHREAKEKERKADVVELTDHQREIGFEFLRSSELCERIVADYERLGYVRENKNKLLLYLVMTSRLMDSPLHALIMARSSAGKSRLAEITEELCPPEQRVSVSDLSAQALFYYGEDDLKHRFVVIGERRDNQASDYPLRELISRRSITKAIPMKDQVTGETKTTTITVNGPISLVETSTSANVNPENLNRCFVVGIDESEEQTSEIHRLQRESFTLDGFLRRSQREQIVKRHIYAQRLLKPLQVFNPFAELLTFPASKLRSRRDNEKFLRLINAICFLHQHQRRLKTHPLADGRTLEYIECTVDDYRTAYELLADGVLENTLDDLPRPARALLDLIMKYLAKRAAAEDVPPERIVFERKDIREYTSWTFAQVRNNFRILKDYEYLKLIKVQNGLANQYRLAAGYTSVDLLHTILSPDELANRLKAAKRKRSDAGDCAREPQVSYGVSA